MAGGGVRDWPWEHVREVLRVYGPDIAQLAERGDELAKRVRARYQYAYDHPKDVGANLALRDALNEYLQRELLTCERRELASKYGHRLDWFESLAKPH